MYRQSLSAMACRPAALSLPPAKNVSHAGSGGPDFRSEAIAASMSKGLSVFVARFRLACSSLTPPGVRLLLPPF